MSGLAAGIQKNCRADVTIFLKCIGLRGPRSYTVGSFSRPPWQTTTLTSMQEQPLEIVVKSFIASLPLSDLERLYTSNGSIWLDTGDQELRLTFGTPGDRGARRKMESEASKGRWVYVPIELGTHDDHPYDADSGTFESGWLPGEQWLRSQLLDCHGEIAAELDSVAQLESDLE